MGNIPQPRTHSYPGFELIDNIGVLMRTIDGYQGNPVKLPEGAAGLRSQPQVFAGGNRTAAQPRKYWNRRDLAEWLTVR